MAGALQTGRATATAGAMQVGQAVATGATSTVGLTGLGGDPSR